MDVSYSLRGSDSWICTTLSGNLPPLRNLCKRVKIGIQYFKAEVTTAAQSGACRYRKKKVQTYSQNQIHQ